MVAAFCWTPDGIHFTRQGATKEQSIVWDGKHIIFRPLLLKFESNLAKVWFHKRLLTGTFVWEIYHMLSTIGGCIFQSVLETGRNAFNMNFTTTSIIHFCLFSDREMDFYWMPYMWSYIDGIGYWLQWLLSNTTIRKER